jgi:hypothetical protein
MPIPDMFFPVEQENRLSALTADIYRFTDEKEAEYLTGRADFNADRENFERIIKSMGLDELIEIYQNAYNGYIAN